MKSPAVGATFDPAGVGEDIGIFLYYKHATPLGSAMVGTSPGRRPYRVPDGTPGKRFIFLLPIFIPPELKQIAFGLHCHPIR